MHRWSLPADLWGLVDGLVNFNCHESCLDKCDNSKFEVLNNVGNKFEAAPSLTFLCIDKGRNMIITNKQFEKLY